MRRSIRHRIRDVVVAAGMFAAAVAVFAILSASLRAQTVGPRGGTGGSVTSVGLSVPAASLFGVTGSPISGSGTLGITTTGTSGGIPYFSSTSVLATSALLATNGFVLGGGAGLAPTATQITGLVLGAGASAPTAYGGAACINQVLSGLNANGAASNCISLTNAYLSPGTFSNITGVGALAAGSLAAGFTVVGPALGGTGIANNAASTLTISGAFATTLTVTNTTSVTLPTSGTLMQSTYANASATTLGSTTLTMGGTTTSISGLTLPSPTFSGTVAGANTIPLSILAQSGANTILGNWTGSAANVSANTMPPCADSGGNHLNYVLGTGVTCGTTSGSGTDTVTTGVSAAGTTQGTATALTTVGAVITTCAAGAGVSLAAPAAGGHTWAVNHGANPCLVYPVSGGTINQLAANAAVSLAVGATAYFVTPTTTTYDSVPQ